MQGLPGCGKTTWARKWVNKDPKNRVRVSRDDIRKQLGPYWIPQREDLVTDIENEMIRSSLRENFSVVIDATNLRGVKRFEYLDLDGIPIIHDENIEIEIKDMTDVPLKTCIQRDQQRKGDDYVGKDVIVNMWNKYLKEE